MGAYPGLTWELIDFDAGELHVGEQLQRVGGRLVRREVKTETSKAPLPLPGLCVTAVKIRRQPPDAEAAELGEISTFGCDLRGSGLLSFPPAG